MHIIFWIFIALVVLAPLPFGMVYTATQALFASMVLALTAGYCLVRWKSDGTPDVGLARIWPEALGFAIVLAWGIVQICTIMPEHLHHPLWVDTAAVLKTEVKGSISLARGAGFEAIGRIAAFGAVFYMALQLGRDRKKAEYLLWALVLSTTFYAVYGLIVYFSGLEKILWMKKTSYLGNLTGVFVNRNSFATYLGLGLLCACSMYMAMFFKALRSRHIGRDKIHHVMQQTFERGGPLLTCALILLTALFLTHSRAGITSTLVALLVLVLFMGMFVKLAGWWYKIISASVLLGALGIFFLSGEVWMERLVATDVNREERMIAYEQTWQAIKHDSWTGYGIGSYEQTFPVFADEKTSHYRKAHSDWLEMIFELGKPAAVLWFAVLAGLTIRCLVGFFRRRRDHVYPAVGFCAAILVGLHSLVDFSLQIPAVAITFAVLLGVGVAQSWGGSR